MTDKKTFGLFIRKKRTEKNYSQKDLAELLHVTEGAVSKWERGASYPDITLITDICNALDISEHEFITASTDTKIKKEQNEAQHFRTIRNVWFLIPTISYIVALVTCFICNLAVNHTLSWFFVVLTSLACAYAFVPTYTFFFKTNKLLVFTVTSLISICLLLFTCAVYSGTVFWVPTAITGILIGYSLLFMPILFAKNRVSDFKFLISFISAFGCTVLLLLSINAWHPFMFKSAILMTCYGFAPFVICSAICGFKFDKFIKSGICVFLGGISFYFTGYIVNKLFNLQENYYYVNFSDWKNCANANVFFITLLSTLVVSAIFIIIGSVSFINQKQVD